MNRVYRYVAAIVIPLGLLVFLAMIASILAYFVLQITGDVLPLAKLVSKGTLLFLILSIYPLMRYFGLNWQALGFARRSVFIKQIIWGLCLGVLTLLPVILVLYFLEVKVLDLTRTWTLAELGKKFAVSLLVAMLVSLAEEPLFRGVLLTALKKKIAWLAAVIVSSVFYAALHFLKTKTKIPYQDLEWNSGFTLMLDAFSNWLNPEIFPAFIALLMVGIFLAVLRSSVPNSLGLCIGCHAGWVWLIKMNKYYLDINHQSDYLYLVSSYDGLVGPLVALWLLVVVAAYWLWPTINKQVLSP